jgi:hypothetical protein
MKGRTMDEWKIEGEDFEGPHLAMAKANCNSQSKHAPVKKS